MQNAFKLLLNIVKAAEQKPKDNCYPEYQVSGHSVENIIREYEIMQSNNFFQVYYKYNDK